MTDDIISTGEAAARVRSDRQLRRIGVDGLLIAQTEDRRFTIVVSDERNSMHLVVRRDGHTIANFKWPK